jgi:RimJ/RimL family protein N-acetyltransferase
MPLMGNAVQLRALEMRDLDLIWAAYQDFDLELTTSGDAPPVSDWQVRSFWKRRIKHPALEMRYFAIEPLPGHAGAGQFAGMCNLQDIDMRNRHAELSIWLGSPDLRGHGYGVDAIRAILPYAFDVVHLEKLYLGVYDFNEAGIRCYERLGFRYEGQLQHQLYYQGRYWDEWSMRMLRTEWDLIRQLPTEGLHPYHPLEQDQAILLMRQVLNLGDVETARNVLRRWWRCIDRDVYSFRQENRLAGLLTVQRNGSSHAPDIVVGEDNRQRLYDALAAASISHHEAQQANL